MVHYDREPYFHREERGAYGQIYRRRYVLRYGHRLEFTPEAEEDSNGDVSQTTFHPPIEAEIINKKLAGPSKSSTYKQKLENPGKQVEYTPFLKDSAEERTALAAARLSSFRK